jgi:hypothetical protein
VVKVYVNHVPKILVLFIETDCLSAKRKFRQMGNFQLNRNKDFQTVVPEDGAIVQPPTKKSKSPNSKTAPAPDGEKFVFTNNFPVVENLPDLSHEHDYPAQKQNVNLLQREPFDFKQTESQLRRKGMADCEFECSQITSYLFVGGCHVAGNWELLKSYGISRVVNCSSAVVENHFINEPSMKYLSINMFDSRQDDIFWFVCGIIQFILKARSLGEKVLIHCEKGVSRSCSFAIAYRMWSTGDMLNHSMFSKFKCIFLNIGETWKIAFEYVKLRRAVCAPNTAFTCNLIEIGEILSNEVVTRNLLFRTAFHLPHDPLTAVLKLCRNAETRKIIFPATSLLDPRGVFVIRATNHCNNNQTLFLWRGVLASNDTVDKARALSASLLGIVTNTDELLEVQQDSESDLFLSCLVNDGAFGGGEFPFHGYDDLFDNKPSLEVALASKKEHDQMRISRDRPQAVRESSIKGFETYPEMGSIRKQLSNRELSSRDLDTTSYPGKISRVPSLKMGSDSRRNSHSKVGSLDISAELSGKHIRPADELVSKLTDLTPTNINSGGSEITRRPDERRGIDKLDFVAMTGAVAPLALQLSSLSQLDESPAPSSRRGSMSGDEVPVPLSIRAVSLKMSQLEEAPSTEVALPVLSGHGLTSRSLVDKISNAIGEGYDTAERSSRRDEQQGSDLDTPRKTTSGSCIIHIRPPSLLSVAVSDTELFQENSLKSDDSSQLRQPEPNSASRILQLMGPEAQSKLIRHEEEVLLRSPSKLRMLSFLVGGVSEGRASVDGLSIFRNNSRIVPLHSVDETERKLSTTTNSTQTISRLASPTSAMMREDSHHGLSLSLTPVVPYKISNAISVPIPGLLSCTPSFDRHTDHVGLSCGPIPAYSSLHNNDQDGPNIVTQIHRSRGAFKLFKPILFQAISRENCTVSRSNRKDALRVFEWQAMGVYDDEDLVDVSLSLW